jgi:hypothetical protein
MQLLDPTKDAPPTSESGTLALPQSVCGISHSSSPLCIGSGVRVPSGVQQAQHFGYPCVAGPGLTVGSRRAATQRVRGPAVRTLVGYLVAAAVLIGCGAAPAQSPARSQPIKDPDRVAKAIRAADVKIGKARPMGPHDYGLAPYVGIGVIFRLPHSDACPDCYGRAFAGNARDLRKLKRYYDELSRSSRLFFSWTFANQRRGVLVQLNGSLPRATATRIKSVVARL